MTPADSPENKCPECRDTKKVLNPEGNTADQILIPCPSCSPVDSGTGCEKHGRTDCEDCYLDALAPGTGTDEKDIYSLVKAAEKTLEMLDAVGYEDKYHGKGELRAALAPFRASVPSSPHETGNFTCEECWGQDGEHEADCPDGGTTAMPPSAAPTNPVPSRSDSEGELRARIEELAEKYEEVAALALGFASEKVSCSSVASDLRSLLVHKEEA